MSRCNSLLRRGIGLWLIVVTAAICAELANAQQRDRQMVRHRGGLIILPDWLTVEPVASQRAPDQANGVNAADDDDEVLQANAIAIANAGLARFPDRWRGRISDDAFNQRVFGHVDATGAHQHLDERLRAEIQSVGDRYGLTASQRQKLLLAGRGDIKRLFDRIEERRLQLTARVAEDVDSVRELSRDFSDASGNVSASFRFGPFGRGSLFAKMLNRTITPEQVAEFEKQKREGAVVTHNSDLRVR